MLSWMISRRCYSILLCLTALCFICRICSEEIAKVTPSQDNEDDTTGDDEDGNVEHDDHPHGDHIHDDGKASVFKGRQDMEDGDKGGGRTLRTGLRFFTWGPVTERVIKRHRIKTLYLLFADISQDYGEQVCSPIFESVAKTFKSKEMLHVVVPIEHIQPFQFFLGDDPQQDLPFGVIVEVNRGFKKYRIAAADQQISSIDLKTRVEKVCNQQAMTQFEQDFFDKKLKAWLRSEDDIVTTYEEEEANKELQQGNHSHVNKKKKSPPLLTVHSLSGRQFDSKIIQSPDDALVLFYAPWCGHCKKFQRKFKELAHKFRYVSHIKFFQVDATKNDIDHPTVNVDRVPYVRYFKHGHKMEAIKYDHAERDVVGYGTQFLLMHTSQPIDPQVLERQDTDDEGLLEGAGDVEL